MNWSSQQALQEDLNYIAAAYAGYAETLETIFGSGEGKQNDLPKITRDAKGDPIVLTPSIFDSQFGEDDASTKLHKPMKAQNG